MSRTLDDSIDATLGVQVIPGANGQKPRIIRPRLISVDCPCCGSACPTVCDSDHNVKVFSVTFSSLGVYVDGNLYQFDAPFDRTIYYTKFTYTYGLPIVAGTASKSWARVGHAGHEVRATYLLNLAYNAYPDPGGPTDTLEFASLQVWIGYGSDADGWTVIYRYVELLNHLGHCGDNVTNENILLDDTFVNLNASIDHVPGASGGTNCETECSTDPWSGFCGYGCCTNGTSWFCSSTPIPFPIYGTPQNQPQPVCQSGTEPVIPLVYQVNDVCLPMGWNTPADGSLTCFWIACDGTVYGWIPYTPTASPIFFPYVPKWQAIGSVTTITSCAPLDFTVTLTDGYCSGQIIRFTE